MVATTPSKVATTTARATTITTASYFSILHLEFDAGILFPGLAPGDRQNSPNKKYYLRCDLKFNFDEILKMKPTLANRKSLFAKGRLTLGVECQRSMFGCVP